MHSSLYVGQVRHRRFLPVEHAFAYRLFMLYLDLDELPGLFERRWLWSARRPNLAWFRRTDHLGDPQVPLATAVRDLVEQASGRRPEGPVRLLTHLRYFGYGFNPVSFYFCFNREDTAVENIVAEVTNTPWKEQFCYVLGGDGKATANNSGLQGSAGRFRLDKAFHVSPFMDMDIRYDWRFTLPGERLAVHMANHRGADKLFDATLDLHRRPVTARTLAGVLLGFPLMTARVTAGIYYQALRLWLKGAPVYTHPDRRRMAQPVNDQQR
jgi:DUF1365 family protein